MRLYFHFNYFFRNFVPNYLQHLTCIVLIKELTYSAFAAPTVRGGGIFPCLCNNQSHRNKGGRTFAPQGQLVSFRVTQETDLPIRSLRNCRIS